MKLISAVKLLHVDEAVQQIYHSRVTFVPSNEKQHVANRVSNRGHSEMSKSLYIVSKYTYDIHYHRVVRLCISLNV